MEDGRPITAEVLQKLYLDTLHSFFGDCPRRPGVVPQHLGADPPLLRVALLRLPVRHLEGGGEPDPQKDDRGGPRVPNKTVEHYLELLRSGGNDHPIKQLQNAGVDFTTTEPTEALVDGNE